MPDPIDVAHATADALFDSHDQSFGADRARYRHHVHRVLALVGLQAPVPADQGEALGIAAFFHDAGIWLDSTWDYLPPSIDRALAELGPARAQHAGLVESLIGEHHRLRRARGGDPLVEAFRRADLTDVSAGAVGAPAVPRRAYRQLLELYPYEGFHLMLVGAAARGVRQDPRHPVPMMKW